ncbi:DinB family protein [Flavitalea sp. BT771]|uniref:DinB family protein n=1 Tax=Flavitalea sp. BT771 TaxID=3063329 RepID=UPI0026E2CE06|nr:DinB family protein [Flavitalea sp. BT771]MDO6435696.1 DinB family protein [Flavitalea sp. BT771]MDV6224597.1 DinB family protein [Flavitalea sp. BT771]
MRKHLVPIAIVALLSVSSNLIFTTTAAAQEKPEKEATLRAILLEQFRNAWNKEDWYAPISIAIEGLTAKQAMWKPADSVHSVGELTYHILFWSRTQLDHFKGNKSAAFSGNNNETFTAFTEASWASTVQQLNQVMADWEKAIETCDEAKLKKWASGIDHLNTHIAYHTGQIIIIRKLANNWDPAKGVR